MSTECKAIFAVASVYNPPAQFFKPACSLTLVRCPIIIEVCFSLLKTRDVEAEAVLFLWKRKRENSTASAFFTEGQIIVQLTDFIGGWLFKPGFCLLSWKKCLTFFMTSCHVWFAVNTNKLLKKLNLDFFIILCELNWVANLTQMLLCICVCQLSLKNF